jgi:hypothetical protein
VGPLEQERYAAEVRDDVPGRRHIEHASR